MPPDRIKTDKRTSPDDCQQETAEQLVREHAGWMLVLAERILNDRALAEDVLQEALLNALKGLQGFAAQSSLKTWLHRITVNAALSKLRKQKRLAEQSFEELLPEFDQFDCRIERPWTHLASVHDMAEHDETRAHISQGIRALPEPYRVVLQLRDIEGYDTGETAELLQTSESNVKVRLHRARAALKKILEPVLRGEEHL